MKQILNTCRIIIFFSLLTSGVYAQDLISKNHRFVSDKGYWVIENNIHSPLNHVIWFYNNDNELLYKESLTGVKMNPDRRSIKLKLKRVLEASFIAWEKRKENLPTDEELSRVKSVL